MKLFSITTEHIKGLGEVTTEVFVSQLSLVIVMVCGQVLTSQVHFGGELILIVIHSVLSPTMYVYADNKENNVFEIMLLKMRTFVRFWKFYYKRLQRGSLLNGYHRLLSQQNSGTSLLQTMWARVIKLIPSYFKLLYFIHSWIQLVSLF